MSEDQPVIPRSVRTLIIDQDRVVSDSRGPLSSATLTGCGESGRASVSGEEIAEALVCGVRARRADGGEILESVDGVELHLDGAGGVRVPSWQGVPGAGVFHVLDDRPATAQETPGG